MPRGIPYGPGMFFSGSGSQTGLKAKWWNPVTGTDSHVWTVPESGLWKFYAWGQGSVGAVFDYRDSGPIYFCGGSSSGLGIITKYLNAGQTVTVQIPHSNLFGLVKLTFPDGTIAQIPRAAAPTSPDMGTVNNAVGGVPTGFDENILGTNGVTGAANGLPGTGTDPGLGGVTGSGVPGGAGAPGKDGLRGGEGGRYGQSPGFPGGGGTYQNSSAGSVNGTSFVTAFKVG